MRNIAWGTANVLIDRKSAEVETNDLIEARMEQKIIAEKSSCGAEFDSRREYSSFSALYRYEPFEGKMPERANTSQTELQRPYGGYMLTEQPPVWTCDCKSKATDFTVHICRSDYDLGTEHTHILRKRFSQSEKKN